METLMHAPNDVEDDAVPAIEQPVCLILTAQNKEKIVESYLRTLVAHCATMGLSSYEIIVIDQNSTDRTLALAEMVARDLTGIHVIHSFPENLTIALGNLKIDEHSIIIFADLAKHPDPSLFYESIHAVSELSWDLVATTNSEAQKYPESKTLNTWYSVVHRMKNSLRSSDRDDIHFLTLSASTFHKCLNTLAVKNNQSNLLASFYSTAQKTKAHCVTRDISNYTQEHPLAPVATALTVSISGLLMGLTVLTHLQITV